MENLTKLCRRCKTEKSISEFYKNSNRRSNIELYCKLCCCEQTMERQRKLKKMCVQYKGGKCIRCGYCKSNVALQFHHRDREQKEFNISKIRKYSILNLLPETKKELDKCDLVCSNCHTEIHEEINNAKWKTVRAEPTTWIKKEEKKCKICNVTISQRSTFCQNCFPRKNKIDWPSNEWIFEKLKTRSFVSLGKELGVSDNAIRKHLRMGPSGLEPDSVD